MGCVHVVHPPVTVPFPTGTHARVEYAAALQAALREQLATACLPEGTLTTQIVSLEQPAVLTGAAGLSFADDLVMTIAATFTDQHGQQRWKGTVTARARAYKPDDQQWYAHIFARARRDVCYDGARHIIEQLTKQV